MIVPNNIVIAVNSDNASENKFRDLILNFSLTQFTKAMIRQAKIKIHTGSQRISKRAPVILNLYTFNQVLSIV